MTQPMTASTTPSALVAPTDPLLYQCSGGRFRGKFRMYFGRFEVTPTRLVYFEHSAWWQPFGALGMLLARSARGKRAAEFDHAQIRSFARGKFGLNKKILDLTMTDGTTHRFSIDKFDELIALLRDLIARGGRRVDDLGGDRWQVA
jgi:hypothetical protein